MTRWLLVLCFVSTAEFAAAQTHSDVVTKFVGAFNARSIDAMLALATDDVEWVNVDGTKLTLETAGKTALRASMTSYFKNCPTCRSEIQILGATETRVTAIETASWQAASGARSQRSVSIYELQNGAIRRVYYFPVEK